MYKTVVKLQLTVYKKHDFYHIFNILTI